ncbi:MAG: polysaccharide deacetylase family protein [Oscillospiraceae bacterium]|nr:polysaccharide deacetylase family protein [Oscillospiraceae bacterium]
MRILLLKKKWMTLCLSLLAAGAIFCAAWYPSAVSTSAAKRQLPIYCVETNGEKRCAISFDAAWGADNTQKILDVLQKYDVPATFFVVGNWADDYPDAMQAIVDAGHEIMNHSNAHDHYNSLSAEQITKDITICNEKIMKLTGIMPSLIRCPYGEYDDHVITTIRAMGMEPIQWDVDSLDWKDLSAAEITQRVTSKVQPGSIVLFHNAGLHTPEALPAILDYLAKEGYTLVPISELILTGEYTIDHAGKQCPTQGK